MKIRELPLKGAFLIDIAPFEDERGFFARSFCINEFRALNPELNIVQQNISYNKTRGTLRGLHFQLQPYGEIKIVRCTRGALYDVIVDLRPDSPTFGKWHGVELTQDNRTSFYIPEGFGHGFITLTDDTEIFYQMSQFYHPTHYRGIRWDDPELAIKWPMPPSLVSEKDAALPTLSQMKSELGAR